MKPRCDDVSDITPLRLSHAKLIGDRGHDHGRGRDHDCGANPNSAFDLLGLGL